MVWVFSSRCSIASAAAVAPPAVLKADAIRSAPGLHAIASRILACSRRGFSCRAGRRAPEPDTSTRLATSSWSRPNGTAHTGTPLASAFWVAPIPPWVTAHTARSEHRRVRDEPLHLRVGGDLDARGFLRGQRRYHVQLLVGQRLQRAVHQPCVVLKLGGGGDEHDRARNAARRARGRNGRRPVAMIETRQSASAGVE